MIKLVYIQVGYFPNMKDGFGVGEMQEKRIDGNDFNLILQILANAK